MVVKETGCGLSRSVGQRVAEVGVEWVDASGAGGTSWVGVEALRAKDPERKLGNRFWDWGIPTAASVAQLSDLKLGICATGGLHDGLDVARAIALGACVGGIARSFLQARAKGGMEGLDAQIRQVLAEIRFAHLLSGSRTPDQLRAKPLVLGPELRRWVPRGSSLESRC